MNIKSYRFPSATGVCEIATNAYTPENGVFDTVLVIHHGMAEHQERYLGFIVPLPQRRRRLHARHGQPRQVQRRL